MAAHAPAIRAVVFDIGETLVDKSREYAGWARAVGTTPHTLSSVFGATVAAGGGAAEVLRSFGEDGLARHAELVAAGVIPPPAEQDLLPGAREVLAGLRAAGLRVGVAGNQPPGYGALLRALDLPADVVATSQEWGVRKPAPEFFRRAVTELLGPDADPATVVYVGDQVDDDVVGATGAGLRAVRVRTGPWGRLVHDPATEAAALAVVDRLTDVPAVLASAGVDLTVDDASGRRTQATDSLITVTNGPEPGRFLSDTDLG